MRWTRGHQSTHVDDRRGEAPVRGFGGGGGLPIGNLIMLLGRFGWKGILVGAVIAGALYFTGMCSGGGTDGTSQRPAVTHKADPADDDLASFVSFVLDDVQSTFGRDIRGFTPARLTLFRGSIRSACGTTSSAIGPFYCPIDHKAYIDLAFYDQLRRQLGAPGDFAQAYVIAHEIGHHVQNQRGLLGKGEVNQVETELQADCLAGAWARDAQRRDLLEIGDIDEALNAASQIGDDTLQNKAQGYVQPETWTHGSAAQRSGSFRRGLAGGVSACGIHN